MDFLIAFGLVFYFGVASYVFMNLVRQNDMKIRAAFWIGLNWWTYFAPGWWAWIPKYMKWGMGKPPYIIL